MRLQYFSLCSHRWLLAVFVARRMSALITLALLVSACAVPRADLKGKACPCVEGWVCDVKSNRCMPGEDDAPIKTPTKGADDAMVADAPDIVSPGADATVTADLDSDRDGVLDDRDACPFDANKTAVGFCPCGVRDDDRDADGTRDCDDACPEDAQKTAFGLCGCGSSDADVDGDNLPECADECPSDPDKRAKGTCGCGVSDADRDRDTWPDCKDGCPDDSAKMQEGFCGCGMPEVDRDGDTTPDCVDTCPDRPLKTAPGVCGCDSPDVDRDGDGALDCLDVCPDDGNKSVPGDCGCGVADTDVDRDGTLDCKEACPRDPLKLEPGLCGCNVAEGSCPLYTASRDNAWKNEGVLQAFDRNNKTKWLANGTANWIQVQLPGDGLVYDHYSITSGNDRSDRDPRDFRLLGSQDNNFSNPEVLDTRAGVLFSDRFQTYEFPFQNTTKYRFYRLDITSTLDPVQATYTQLAEWTLSFTGQPDNCPADVNKTEPGACGCGTSDIDSDRDGVSDCQDGCPQTFSLSSPGACGCGEVGAEGKCVWTTRLPVEDAYTSSGQGSANFGAAATLLVDSEPTVFRTLIKPRSLGDIPAGAKVIDASLRLYIFDGGNDPSVRPLSSTWSPTTVTLNTAPGMGAGFATLPGANGGFASVSITSVVQTWVDGAPTYGLALDPTGPDRVDMRSSDYVSPYERPTIDVRWTVASP